MVGPTGPGLVTALEAAVGPLQVKPARPALPVTGLRAPPRLAVRGLLCSQAIIEGTLTYA